MNSLLIKDESMTGENLGEVTLLFPEEQVTVKDIISQRVEKEVDDYNQKLPSVFNGLIQPSEAEKAINGYKMKKRVKIDVEKQILVALAAFQENGFFVLVDDHQAESLYEVVQIKAETTISFVKLTALVGG